MADYSYSCCAGPPHKESCRFHHKYDTWRAEQDYLAKMRAQGFVPLEPNKVAFRCRRGCGTLVWDIDMHIKNVCPTFNPVVG